MHIFDLFHQACFVQLFHFVLLELVEVCVLMINKKISKFQAVKLQNFVPNVESIVDYMSVQMTVQNIFFFQN